MPKQCNSLRRARATTTRFHNLTCKLEQAKEPVEIARLQMELGQLGGRDEYQQASKLTTSRHRTARYVFATLTRLGLRPHRGQRPLTLLEIGAVNLDLVSTPWLATRAIDVRSQHPRIEQVDFFALPQRRDFDVVVCAMVLNCVSNAEKRGDMLRGMREHLKPGGLAFLCLPRRCFEKSPFTTHRSFRALLRCVGLETIHVKRSPSIIFICARAAAVDVALRPVNVSSPSRVIAHGRGYTNNFAVLISETRRASDAAVT